MAYHTRPGEGVNSCCGRPWLTVHTRHSRAPGRGGVTMQTPTRTHRLDRSVKATTPSQ